MAKEKFILVSLKDDESKKLAQIVTNDSSRKILDYLAEKEATESEISEKLNVPISTIHYNLQALVKAKLVEADEYHYSQKGKEVLHYKLANKYIIIAPKSTYGIKERLKSILPVAIFAIVGSLFIHFINSFQAIFGKTADKAIAVAPQAMKAAEIAEDEAIAEVPVVLETAGRSAAEVVTDTATNVVAESTFWQTFVQTPALWFLFGCVFTILLIIIGEYLHYRRTNK
jgi:DNA-binding transcriptional ArsR family regulator